VSVIALLIAVGAGTETGADPHDQSSFRDRMDLVGAATPFSTWSRGPAAGRERSTSAMADSTNAADKNAWL
jgi:hypothetical protein